MSTERRQIRMRALRASLAVTLGSSLLFACSGDAGGNGGTDSEGSADAISADGTTLPDGANAEDGIADTDPGTDTPEPNPDAEADVAVPPDADDVAVDGSSPEPDATVDVESPDTTPDVDRDVALDVDPDVEVDAVADIDPGDVTAPDADLDVDLDTGSDLDTADVVPDGVSSVCLAETDSQCPTECTPNTDYDCCMASGAPGLCFFDPGFGCGCAIEGPFAPPSMPLRTVA
jgi:hypothetical protein